MILFQSLDWRCIGRTHINIIDYTWTTLNPGNSGGPLLNSKSLGINTFGNTRAQGINFSVSNDSLREFFDRLIISSVEDKQYEKIGFMITTRISLSILIFDKNENGMISTVDTIGIDLI